MFPGRPHFLHIPLSGTQVAYGLGCRVAKLHFDDHHCDDFELGLIEFADVDVQGGLLAN